MQYKSMVLLFTMMLGIVFSLPEKALGKHASVDVSNLPTCGGEPTPIESLRYMGQKITDQNIGRCWKIENVSTDREARAHCPAGKFLINPGNPQYQVSSNDHTHGERGVNSLHYYFCVDNFDKLKVCNQLGLDRTDLQTFWKPVHGTDSSQGKQNIKSDGDCMCGAVANQMHDCGDSIPPVAGNSVKDKCEKLGAAYTEAKTGSSGGSCICPSIPGSFDPDSPTKCPAAKETATPVTGTESQQIVDCVNEFETKLNECKQQADKANATCDDKNDSNKTVDNAKKIVSSVANSIIQKAAGTGAQSQCAAANMLATGSYSLMNQLKASCNDEIKSCKDKCSEIKEGLPNYCKSKIQQDQSGGTAEGKTPDDNYIDEQNKKFGPLVISDLKVCGVEAVEKGDLLHDALRGYDSAAKSSALCACQLSTSGKDCTTLPSPADCHFNPSLPTCTASLNCVIGASDYASAKCNCLRDPSTPDCAATLAKVPFAFAGDLKALAPGGGSLGGIGTGGIGGDSGMDLGGMNQQDAQKDSKIAAQGDAPGIGVNAAAGGGGPSGGGDGGAGTGAPSADAGEPTEKNLGFMGLVKSAVGNMFGSKPGAAAKNKISGRGSAPGYDVDKWRPRGLASSGCNASQIRCKNEDIFTIVNKRYLNNEMSFIQNP